MKVSLFNENTIPVKSSGLRRRPGRRFDKAKLRRRCSINGHYYNRETSIFTPPYGMLHDLSCFPCWLQKGP